MSINLAELQSRFANELLYGESPFNNPCLIDSDVFTPDERLQVYRNNFVIGLSEVLEATYPVTKALVGEECFSGLARKHILSNPLLEGDVSGYGAGFDRTIKLVESVSTPLPYLPDIARLEFAFDSSNRELSKASPRPLMQSLEELSTLTNTQQDRVKLHLRTGVSAIDSKFAILSIYGGVMSGKLEGIEIDKPENVLVFSHRQNQIEYCALSTNAYRLIGSINSGQYLSQIAPGHLSALQEFANFDILAGFTLSES